MVIYVLVTDSSRDYQSMLTFILTANISGESKKPRSPLSALRLIFFIILNTARVCIDASRRSEILISLVLATCSLILAIPLPGKS